MPQKSRYNIPRRQIPRLTDIREFDYPRKLRFQCERCAKCCGDTPKKNRSIMLLDVEAKRISQKTKLSYREFLEETATSGSYRHRMKKDGLGKCLFLRDSVCTIYDARPLVCVFYPFELSHDEKGAYTFSFTDECPNVGRGQPLYRSFFSELFEKSLMTFQKDASCKDKPE